MAPRGPPTVETTSSSVQPFPPVSPDNLRRINNILAHLPAHAHSWTELTQARERAEGRVAAGTAAQTESEGEDEVFNLLLLLTWQDGTTWYDKWANAKQGRVREGDSREERSGLGGSGGRALSRRPSDGVDLLKKKLAGVTLDVPSTSSSTARQTAANARLSGQRSRPTPPPAASSSRPPQATSARPLLVRPEQGYSSSDDYVGVPRAAAASGPLTRALERDREREKASQGREEKAARRLSRPAKTEEKLANGAPYLPAQAASPGDARHPLLQQRLAALAHPSAPPLSSLPTAKPSLAPAPSFSRPAVAPPRPSSAASSLPFLISGQYSPPEADAIAQSFARLSLIGRAFDGWRALSDFHAARERELDERRATWLRRCAVQGWHTKLERIRQAQRKAEEYARGAEDRRRKRALRGSMNIWREKRQERVEKREEERRLEERERRENELREARDSVARIRNRGVARRAMEHWYQLALTSRALRFHRRSLLIRSFSTLHTATRASQHRAATLLDVAEEQWATNEAGRTREALMEWRRRAAIKTAEKELAQTAGRRLMTEAWEVWRDKRRQADYRRHLEAAAVQHYASRLASSALARWLHRKRQIDDLSALSLSHSHSLLLVHTRTLTTTWRLRTRLSLSLRSSSTNLASRSLEAWLNRYEHLEVELAGRALAFAARKDNQLRAVAFSAWEDAAGHHARLAQAATAVARRNALARAMGRWSRRERAAKVEERKADVVRDFMLQRTAWRRWMDRAWEAKRERWVEEKKRGRKKEALAFWLDRTRQKQQDRRLSMQVEQRRNQRTLSSSVAKWKQRVILRHELENQATAWFERGLLQSGFKRWGQQTVKAAERLRCADEHRAAKLEELRDRTFHAWLSSSRKSLDLKRRLADFTADKQDEARENAFGKWRERSLRKIEATVTEKRDGRLKAAGLQKWRSRSKALTATHFYSSRLAVRAFATWQHWTPPFDLSQRAVEADRTAISSGALQVWRIKAQAKIQLKGLSRLRIGSSPSSSPPAPRAPSRTLQATPSPIEPRRQALTQVASTSPSSSMHSSTPSRSISTSRSVATPATSVRTPHPSSSRWGSCPRGTPTTPLPPSSASRPRLSAEYGNLPFDRTAARPPAPRTRSRSISSLRSVQTSRSAPAGRADVFSSDEDDASCAAADERSFPPSPFGRAAARHTSGVAKSEGGEASSDGRSSRRDVRGEYAALKERLREAAARARGGA